jgi:hypothetical protein
MTVARLIAAKDTLPLLRKTSVYTWSPSQSADFLSTVGSGSSTQVLCVPCPDDFYAVRVGFMNITTSTYDIPLIKVCPSTTFNDYINPTGGASWVPLTAQNAGKDVSEIVNNASAPTAITVAGNTTDPGSGNIRIQSWYFTDWVNVNSVTPDPTTNMRVLMIRHLLTKGQLVIFADGTFRSGNSTVGNASDWTGNAAVNNGYDYFTAAGLSGDSVTSPGVMSTQAQVMAGALIPGGSVVACVQFLTAHEGIVGLTTGDSQYAGNSTNSGFNGFLLQAMSSLGKANVGALPYGIANSACSATQSFQFFQYFQGFAPFSHASFVVLPGWSWNNNEAGTHADSVANNIGFARLLVMLRWCREQGLVPIIFTPLPNIASNMGSTQQTAWLALYNSLIAMRNTGTIVIDVSTPFSDTSGGHMTGIWPAGSPYNNGGSDPHPNDAGHAAIAALLKTQLALML